jgi:NAD(P)-dependent dehydrogenase (short-subunit alcohol dehydrogenase family)
MALLTLEGSQASCSNERLRIDPVRMTDKLQPLTSQFPERRAFIAGASTGLGLALARALGQAGWSLGLFDRDAGALAKAEAELTAMNVAVQAYPGDVTQVDELTVAVNSFANTHDGIDIMINNAGILCAGSVLETPPEEWRRIMDINLLGVVHGCRASVPHLQRHGRGLLINIAAATAFTSTPRVGAYSASCAAVVSLSETLAVELSSGGIQVSVAMPGWFRTSLPENPVISAHARTSVQSLLDNSDYDAATAAVDLLLAAARGRTYIVVPATTRWLWRYKRWFPERFLFRRLRDTYGRPIVESEAPNASQHESLLGKSMANKNRV